MASLHVISGGAEGADSEWVRALSAHARVIDIWSFPGHQIHYMPMGTNVRILSESDKQDADAVLRRACVGLSKRMPRLGTFTHKLLQRNFCIARDAECMVVIGRRLLNQSTMWGAIGVDGGTAWACQMFANKFADAGHSEIPLFVCDNGTWFRCVYYTQPFFVWKECALPAITGKCAFIGSRDLTDVDKAAIQAVALEYSARN